MSAVLFKNIHLTDPAAGIDGPRDVLVAGGCVERVALQIAPDAAADVRPGEPLSIVYGEGLWLWPGLVDAHVHFREPGFTEKETIRTGSLAAAAGGYTSVICEPNTDPPIDSVDLARNLADKVREEAAVNVYLKAAMTAGRLGREPADIGALAQEESFVALSDDGDPVVDEALMEAICRLAAEHDILLTPHCEDSSRALAAMNAGAEAGFEPAEPYANEASYIERDLRLAAGCGCRIHFSHVSLARSVEAIADFRARADHRARVTFEITPHHVLLCDSDFVTCAVPTVNPPLRSAHDRDALAQALCDGTVDAVASDHAPHTARDKAEGASGLIGLETTLGLVLTHFVAGGRLSTTDAVRLLSHSPARIFGLRAGTLQPGYPADMVLIDPSCEWTVSPEQFRSKSRNTPFGGWNLRGRAVATYVAGAQVYAAPDFGRQETL